MTPAKRLSIYRRGQTGSKGNWLRTENAKATLSRIGFAGCASRTRGGHSSVSVTHRFFRRGFFEQVPIQGPGTERFGSSLVKRKSLKPPRRLVTLYQ